VEVVTDEICLLHNFFPLQARKSYCWYGQ